MSCQMCNCECAVNPQKQGIKPGVMHNEKLYCHECKDVLDFLGDDTPKKPKKKEVEKPKKPNNPKPTHKSYIMCPKCKIPVEKQCTGCKFKNPLAR